MTPIELSKNIASGKFDPVYFFYGIEDYRKIEAVKTIADSYIPSAQKKLNYIKMSAAKDGLEAILGEMAAIPMLGERRLIYVEDIQKLKPTQQEKLFAFFKTPLPETVVILQTPASYDLKKTSGLYKKVSKIAQAVQFDRLSGGDARTKIIKQLTDAGISFDSEAVELLIAITGGDFGGIVGELEKISLALEAGSHIGIEEVKNLSSSHAEFSIFDLIDHIADKNSARALIIYNDLIDKGQNPVSLVYMLSRHMQNLMKIHAGKTVAGHPFFVGKLKKQARDYGPDAVARAVAKIAETDKNIRHSKLAPRFQVENLVREISV